MSKKVEWAGLGSSRVLLSDRDRAACAGGLWWKVGKVGRVKLW